MRELAAAVADGRLSSREQRDVAGHLSACARCQAEVEKQRLARRIVRAAASRRVAPEGLRARVRALASGGERGRAASLRRGTTRRAVLAGAIAASVLLGLGTLLQRPSSGLLELMAQDVRAAEAGELPLELRADDIAAIRSFYLAHPELGVRNPVADLSAGGYRPVGASVSRAGGISTTLTVYSGDRGPLVCRRFPAGRLSLPPGGSRVGETVVYRVGDVTLRVKREGETICCMAARMSDAELLDLLRRAGLG